jgi:hypothetical protein
MIELLRIHAIVRLARVLVLIGRVAEAVSMACRQAAAGGILDDVTAWADARDAAKSSG